MQVGGGEHLKDDPSPLPFFKDGNCFPQVEVLFHGVEVGSPHRRLFSHSATHAAVQVPPRSTAVEPGSEDLCLLLIFGIFSVLHRKEKNLNKKCKAL